MSDVKMDAGWKTVLADEFKQSYFQDLVEFLKREKAAKKVIYPPGSLIFNAFNSTPFDAVKVVILGQDPYHNPGEAMGLSFSVPKGMRVPPSLVNIYKALHADLGLPIPPHGDLSPWASEGVFMLNAMLTVEHNRPQSHQHIGWQTFTDAVIGKLSAKREGLVFLLWGNFAKKKKLLIDTSRHLVLEAQHPSPLAGTGFSGCRHFSKANIYLESRGMAPVNWAIAP
jgi:uracil-DNA glycosylase